MRTEVRDITASALLLALAFGIAITGGFRTLLHPNMLARVFIFSLIGVSLGFILHEMGHRYVARRFGCFAQYRMWPAGLAAACIFSLFGFVFAAPGAVEIHSGGTLGRSTNLGRREIGLIALTGPVVNLCLALVFMALSYFSPALAPMMGAHKSTWMVIFSLGAQVNTWLAIFNLIPFGPLDGAKVFAWDKRIWVITLLVGIAFYIW